ncbi:MAG: glycoside hydrolase family 43 protein [Oscillospiraceae bacterium]|jgi:alpha-N-arabinofuranosidase|nr:glycoside hydrolase family 43 protein [Oscillospiraceae bacterium]
MIYQNPIIRGYYPDPSVCKANGKYYLVTSSSHYFPGVPLFQSEDLINWEQIGYCLTKKSQLPLNNADSSGGIFAPTIRFNNGRFYMVTTNTTIGKNFYVYTDDIYSEWSDPIIVNQGGIDPSLYFENSKTYFMSNGEDNHGKSAILQCEIDINTGEILTDAKAIWGGTGGRYLESPHLYKINDYYYLTAAEGGTEYGHMVTYARGKNIYGPFTPYDNNPVLTNRNLGGYIVQGVGHAELIEDYNGNWWLFHLGFRQIGRWLTYHHLGREVFLMPVTFDDNGWFSVGENGTTTQIVETDLISKDITQNLKKIYSFENTDWKKDWQFIREFNDNNYEFGNNSIKIKSNSYTLDDNKTIPSFIGIRQKEFDFDLSVNIKVYNGEAGVTLYMDEDHHYDLIIEKLNNSYNVALILNIGDIKHTVKQMYVGKSDVILRIKANALNYEFYCDNIFMGKAQTRYLSKEVAGGFTGVLIGLFAQRGEQFSEFTDFLLNYDIKQIGGDGYYDV